MERLKIQRTLVSLGIAALILFIGFRLKDNLASRPPEVRQMSMRDQQKTVKVERVEYRSREIAISNIGKVLSENAIDVVSEVQGEILRGAIPIKRGQRFRRGQVLLKIDDEEAELALFAQKSNFMTAIAGILPDLKIDYPDAYERWQNYFDNLSVEKSLPALPDIQNSQEKVFFSTRNIINQFYTIKSTEERLSKYTVRAPFSGSFVEVFFEENSVVSPGSRVARIAQSNRLELEVPIRTDDLKFVRNGMQVAVFSEGRDHTWKGTVRRIGSTVDATTQSVNIYIRFNPDKAVYEGQYFRAEIPGTRLKDVMEIPRNAVFNKNLVYAVNDSNRLEIQQIQIEKFNDETLLFSGLETDTRVVVEPLVNAFENMRVNVLGEMTEPKEESSNANKVGNPMKSSKKEAAESRVNS